MNLWQKSTFVILATVLHQSTMKAELEAIELPIPSRGVDKLAQDKSRISLE